MPKRVVDLGNCDMDHGQLRAVVETTFDAKLVRCHTAEDALRALREGPVDLMLVNRQLDQDLTEGIDVIRTVKQDPKLQQTPCILLSNFAEFQQAAEAAGAEPGFGKRALRDADTIELLAKFLS